MNRREGFISFIILLSGFLSLALARADASSLRTVALSGSHAPGTPAEVTFDVFGTSIYIWGYPVLNNEGHATFLGYLNGPGVSRHKNNNLGVWAEREDVGLKLIALRGNRAPGTPEGVVFQGFSDGPVLNDVGQIAFRGSLSGEGTNFTNYGGIWAGTRDDDLHLTIRAGDQAPGTTSGAEFRVFRSFAFNEAGQTAFRADLIGTGVNDSNNQGVWSDGGGAGFQIVAMSGSQAPDTPSGVQFEGFLDVFLNDLGQTTFSGGLTGTGVTRSNERGIWSEVDNEGLRLVARTGNQAPGMPVGAIFGGIGEKDTNDSGQVTFNGHVSGPGIDNTNNIGIWSDNGPSGLALVARRGDHAPGTSTGVAFDFLLGPSLNNAGQTAFLGLLSGNEVSRTNDKGIWSEGGGNGLTMIAREGTPAPGTSEDVVFSNFGRPAINNAGQTLFNGILTGPGIDDSNNRGIWAEDRSGRLTLIARLGDLLDVSDDPAVQDARVIEDLVYLERAGFNDFGQFAFVAKFTNGTAGVFVSNAATVPEPGSLILAITGLTFLAVKVPMRKRFRRSHRSSVQRTRA